MTNVDTPPPAHPQGIARPWLNRTLSWCRSRWQPRRHHEKLCRGPLLASVPQRPLCKHRGRRCTCRHNPVCLCVCIFGVGMCTNMCVCASVQWLKIDVRANCVYTLQFFLHTAVREHAISMIVFAVHRYHSGKCARNNLPEDRRPRQSHPEQDSECGNCSAAAECRV